MSVGATRTLQRNDVIESKRCQFLDIRITDHIGLKAMEWGAGSTTCLLLHGLGDSAVVWHRIGRELAQSFRAIALDLRGHGCSDWDLGGRYDAATMVDDVASVYERLGINRALVIGHSLGGEIAVRLAAQQPGKVSKLVLLDFGPELDPDGVTQVHEELATTPRCYASIEDYVKRLEDRHPLASSSTLAHMASYALTRSETGGYQLKGDPAALAPIPLESGSVLYRQLSEDVLWRLLARVECPTLVVRGEGSSVLKQSVAARMVDDVLQRGSLAVIQRAGHCVLLDNPDGVIVALRSFLSGKIKASRAG